MIYTTNCKPFSTCLYIFVSHSFTFLGWKLPINTLSCMFWIYVQESSGIIVYVSLETIYKHSCLDALGTYSRAIFKMHYSWCAHAYMCACHGAYVEARGWLSEASQFSPSTMWITRIQLWCGSKHLYSLALEGHFLLTIYLWTWLISEYMCSLAYNGSVSW